jgi:RNA-directed DNA polymerase
MKRYGNLFEKICDIDNLMLAHQNARKGKSSYREVQMIDKNPRYYAEILQKMLFDQNFKTSKYQIFWKDCGTKKRLIHKLPYWPDRIVQHAIMQILEPIWLPTLIRDTFQSIKGRGTHDARQRIQKIVRSDDAVYCLNLDIKKFYPSVDNDLMKQIVRQKIKCKETLHLLDDIVDSTLGLPVGNYISQILGNVYLSSLDHYMKERLKVKYYYRYCDDIVIFAKTKEELHRIKDRLFSYIDNLRLEVKSNWQIFPLTKRPLDFIGWVFSKKSTRLRKRTAKRFETKCKQIKRNHRRIDEQHALSSIMSYWGQIKYVNAKCLWKKVMDGEMLSKTDKYCVKSNPIRGKVA